MFSPALFIAFAINVSSLPSAESLFAYRQGTIDAIKNFEANNYCVLKTNGNRESVFGPLTYRRSGEMVMYVSTDPQGNSESIITRKHTKTLESSSGRIPKFGVIDKPMLAHFCRDPWSFSSFLVTVSDSDEQVPLQQVFLPEYVKNAKVEQISADIYRVTLNCSESVSVFEFDKSIGYQLRYNKISFTGEKKLDSSKKFEDYVFVGKIPIAQTIKEHTEFNGRVTDIVMKLSKISVNLPEIDRKMTLDFPVGIKVKDYIDQVSYRVGKNGERLDVEPIQIARMLPPESTPSVTMVPTPTVEMPSYPTYSWVLLSSIVLLTVALVVRWRLGRRQGVS